MAKNKEKAGAGKTIVILLVVLLLLLTAGAYGYGVHYFSSHFLPGSMVNGFNCSYITSSVLVRSRVFPTTSGMISKVSPVSWIWASTG